MLIVVRGDSDHPVFIRRSIEQNLPLRTGAQGLRVVQAYVDRVAHLELNGGKIRLRIITTLSGH